LRGKNNGMRPIRVLYMHRFDRIGGAERALLGSVDAIKCLPVEPLVVWPRQDDAYAWLQSRNVPVALLDLPAWKHGFSLALQPRLLFRLRRLVASDRVDLVHVNNYRSSPFGRLVARQTGAPCVCHVRELISSTRIRKFRLHSLHALIAVSDAVSQSLVDGGIPPARVTTVRSGVAMNHGPSLADPHRVRKDLGIPADAPLLGIVAHILPHKGYDDLLHALVHVKRRYPRVTCLIVGAAPRKEYRQHLMNLAERLLVREQLVWVGYQGDVIPFLGAMDAFVLPSRTEGFPLTVLEAMAAGRAVIATAVGGIPEVVQHGVTGLLVPSGQPLQLADAIVRILGSPALATSMGEAGRRRIEAGFTLDGEMRRIFELYQSVLKQPPSPSPLESPEERR
jgi:glycosyltransferase involved in cell wall biosynthesis